MDKQPVGQLPDLTQSSNDDEIMVITNSEYNQLKKEKISDLITDFTSTNENNALTKGTDGKMFVTDFGNASNITEGKLPVSVLPDIPKDLLPEIETADLPVSGVSADTYAYPSSVTVNAQGQVTAITEGTPSGNNANVDLSNITEAAKEVIRENSGSGFNLFDIVVKDHVLSFAESKGLAPLGSYVYKDAVSGSRYGYPDFYAKCVEEKTAGTETQTQLGDSTITTYNNSNGHIFYDIADKAIVDAYYEEKGAAWFYGVDTVNERIFLPRTTRFQYTSDVSKVGKYQEAGLPNITGSFRDLVAAATDLGMGYGEGAFRNQNLQGNAISKSSISTAGDGDGIDFDASRSSSIYGNSDTVTPSATNMLLYMVVGNTEVESAATDIVDITTSENDTLPLYFNVWSATDLTTTGAFVNASLGSYLSGNVWTTVYNDLVSKIGQSFCAGEVKAYGTEGITDYDCVVNQDDMTFRLPLKNGQEVMFATRAKGNGKAMGFTNGSQEFGTVDWNTTRRNGSFITQSASGLEAGSSIPSTETVSNKVVGLSQNPDLSGIVIDTDNIQIPEGFNLYFKLGNALQNQQIIDVAAILSALNAKTDAAQAANASMPSGKYEDLLVGSSGDQYTAPADGYFWAFGRANVNGDFYVGLTVISSGLSSSQGTRNAVSGVDGANAFVPVKKNDTIQLSYGGIGDKKLRFIYAQGAQND